MTRHVLETRRYGQLEPRSDWAAYEQTIDLADAVTMVVTVSADLSRTDDAELHRATLVWRIEDSNDGQHWHVLTKGWFGPGGKSVARVATPMAALGRVSLWVSPFRRTGYISGHPNSGTDAECMAGTQKCNADHSALVMRSARIDMLLRTLSDRS